MNKSIEKEIAEDYNKVRNLRRVYKKKPLEEEYDFTLKGNIDSLPNDEGVKVHSKLFMLSVSDTQGKSIEESEKKEYVLKEVHGKKILQAIAELMYNGSLISIKLDSVDEYLQLNNCLKLEGLKILLADFERVLFRDMISPSKYLLNIKELESKPDQKELLKSVKELFSKSTNFLISKRRKEFLVLSYEEFDCLSSDSTFTPTKELFFLRLIISWVRYDFDKRFDHFQVFLNKVSFSGLIWEDYASLRAQLTRDKRFRVVMKSFFKRYMEYMHKFMPDIIELRKNGEPNYHVRYERPYVLLCPGVESIESSLTLYSTIDMQEIEEESLPWLFDRIPDKPKVKTSNIFISLELNQLYIVEKENCLIIHSLNLAVPKAERKWTQCLNIENFPRYTCAVMIKNIMYFIGGMKNESQRKNVLMLDMSKSKLELVESPYSLLEPAVSASACTEDSKIFVTGGVNHKNASITTCQYLDTSTKDGWKALPSMKYSRTTHSCYAFNGKLYAIGGSNTDQRTSYPTEYLEIGENNWTALAMTSIPHSSCGLIALQKSPTYKEHELLIFDKYGERYDPAERKWLQNQLTLSNGHFSSHVIIPCSMLK